MSSQAKAAERLPEDAPAGDALLAAWQAKVRADLGLEPGASLAKLTTTRPGGFAIDPLYVASPPAAGVLRHERGWVLAPSVVAAEPELANVVAEEISGGAEAVFFDGARDAAHLLSEIVGTPTIGFERSELAVVRAVLGAYSSRASAPRSSRANPGRCRWLGIDPVVVGFAAAAEATAELGETNAIPAVIDSRAWEGSPADELAFALAAGLALAGRLEAYELDAAEATRFILWTVPLGTDFLLQTAKLRALRRLWDRVLTLAKSPERPPIQIRGVASLRWATVYDPWVNLLRNTAATFAGALGGADLLTPLPYDAALGTPDADARRLARNTVHLLAHEAHLARVADIAAGSYAIETWTETLAARAWGLAQEVEALGGFEAALASGFVAERVAATRAQETARLAKRQDGLVGTSLFPNLAEVRPVRPAVAGAGALDIAPRLAEPFERLRAAGEASGACVALVTIGSPAEHLARLAFAQGFYELAGIRTVEVPDGPALADEIRDLVAGKRFVLFANEASATLAVICGSDRAYPDAVPRVAPQLAAAGIARIVVAGRPGGLEAAYRAAGVHAFIYAGLDVLDNHHANGAPHPSAEDAR